ncbi:MAG: TIGR02266 family protein [Deltaproteobacteria bacterium]|nr:TIGR02266 family protein [Deltaproteobacteria bacterium]
MSVGVVDSPSSLFRASRPARQARDWLAECLGPLQDIQTPGANLEMLAGHVAKAIGALFAVQSSGPEEPAHMAGVQQAMGHLRGAMQALQDLGSDEPAVVKTTQTIAAVLAFLYPLQKAQERASMVPPPPGPPKDVPHDPRRTARRLPLDVDIGFQSETNFYVGFSEDISEGGLFVATYDFLPLGSRLAVNFTLPDGHVVRAESEVRWVREHNPRTPEMMPGMGVQFLDLTGEDRSAVERFLRRRAPLFHEHG